MLPAVIACIVGIVIAGYTICALGSAMGGYDDPHDWEDEDED